MKWLVLILAVILLFFNLGSNHLANWDEAWYAAISREMATSGNFLTPVWNSRPFFEKPPLYFWTSALVMKVFGVNEFSARVPSALAGVGLVWLVYLLGKLLFKKEVGLTAMLILTSTIGFLYRSRTGNLDTFLSFWIMLAIYTYYCLTATREGKWAIGLVLSIVAAFLTKGLIALAFPAVVVSWALISRQREMLPKRFWLALAAAILVIFVWFGLYNLWFGQAFLSQFLHQQGEKIGISWRFWQNFSWTYVGYLWQGLKLWFILAVPAIIYSWFRLAKTKASLLLAYLTVLLVVLSFISDKSDWYLLPLYAPIALITASAIWEVGERVINKQLRMLVVIPIILVVVWQLVHYQNQYFTPDVAADEARVALAAKQFTRTTDALYLTNYYYPTTIYYSQRQVYAVYSEQPSNPSWWILPKTAWPALTKPDRVFVITTQEEWGFLKDALPESQFKILYQSGEKILLGKQS